MRFFLTLLASFFAASAVSAQTADVEQFRLPRRLVEVSGLAVADANSVWAHNDEHGIVYRLSLETGEFLEAFALGDPTLRDDLEGVATLGGNIYLINSTGHLYEAPIGEHGKRVRFNVYDTGLADKCEVEGLTNFDDDAFLIVCKTPLEPELTGRLSVFKWSLAAPTAAAKPWLSLPFKSMLPEDLAPGLFPSAVDFEPASKTLHVLSARNRVLLRIDMTTQDIEVERLDKARHFQPEGLVVMPDGRVVIADEGALRLPARLSIYPRK